MLAWPGPPPGMHFFMEINKYLLESLKLSNSSSVKKEQWKLLNPYAAAGLFC